MHLIQKVLIANRGEIACRIARTCREMGIQTVAVCSEVDVEALHVKACDEAVVIGEAPSAESYLRIRKLIEAAKERGAQAIHPGYGFLSENVAFAQACEAAGLIFIGPSSDAIAKMGSKIEAKRLLEPEGVPVIPGYQGDDQGVDTLVAEAEAIGFPLLIKASAGGGGKGMRVIREAADLAEEILAAKREALKAFADDRLLLERYIDDPRHIEVQIFGDHQGNIVHIFERECSIQRRHQKVIEESPSPVLDGALREKICAAAVRAAQTLSYYNAGTVEFILAPDGEFYFLEINTRLQVEHPVTEMVSGLDLVRWQIQIAQGLPLPLTQEALSQTGHSIECRIYAEDPEQDFLPASGILEIWDMPEAPWLRIDSGVQAGDEVSIHYDPMLAKIIVWGQGRHEAIRRMAHTLRQMCIQGVKTNLIFLRQVLAHPAFIDGAFSTHFIAEHFATKESRLAEISMTQRWMGAALLTLGAQLRRVVQRTLLPGVLPGWRNNRYQHEESRWIIDGETYPITYEQTAEGHYRLAAGPHWLKAEIYHRDITETGPDAWQMDLHLRLNHLIQRVRVYHFGTAYYLFAEGQLISAELEPRFPVPENTDENDGAVAPMPGKVLRIDVAVGDRVEAGQTLLILEAMKMEHALKAVEAGQVQEIRVDVGEQVEAGLLLVELASEEA